MKLIIAGSRGVGPALERAPTTQARERGATLFACPTCHAWIGWACEGRSYGYHAAGYHPARRELARQFAAAFEVLLLWFAEWKADERATEHRCYQRIGEVECVCGRWSLTDPREHWYRHLHAFHRLFDVASWNPTIYEANGNTEITARPGTRIEPRKAQQGAA